LSIAEILRTRRKDCCKCGRANICCKTVWNQNETFRYTRRIINVEACNVLAVPISAS